MKDYVDRKFILGIPENRLGQRISSIYYTQKIGKCYGHQRWEVEGWSLSQLIVFRRLYYIDMEPYIKWFLAIHIVMLLVIGCNHQEMIMFSTWRSIISVAAS